MSLEIVFDEDFYFNFNNANIMQSVPSDQEILPSIKAENIEEEMNQNLYAENINAVYKPMLIVSRIILTYIGWVLIVYIC